MNKNKAVQKDREHIKNALCEELATLEHHPIFLDDFKQEIKCLNHKSTSKQRIAVTSKTDNAIQLINKARSKLQLITVRSNSKSMIEAKDAINEILLRAETLKKQALLNCLENHRKVVL